MGGMGGGMGLLGGGLGLGSGLGLGGGGSPLLTGLMAGGLGYMLGSNRSQQAAQQQPAQAPAPPPQAAYPAQPYPAQPYPAQPYPAQPPAQTTSGDSATLAQLQLLGQLHASGTLTDQEFATEKQRILGGS